MIKTFADKETENIYLQKYSKKLPSDIQHLYRIDIYVYCQNLTAVVTCEIQTAVVIVRQIETILNITPQRLQQVAQAYLDLDRLRIVIAGDKSQL